jgi:hypothetical protein
LIVSLPGAHRALDLAEFGIGVPGYSSPLGDIEPHLDAQMECSALGRPRVQENVAIPLSRFSFAAEKNGKIMIKATKAEFDAAPAFVYPTLK